MYVEGGVDHRSEESGEREANGEDEGGEEAKEGGRREEEGRGERAKEETELELLEWGMIRAVARSIELCH